MAELLICSENDDASLSFVSSGDDIIDLADKVRMFNAKNNTLPKSTALFSPETLLSFSK